LRYQEGLEFGRGVSATDEPDLWRREGDGRVSEWIEVGQPDAKRLIKACRQSGRCQLFISGEGALRWRKAQLDGMKIPDNLGVAHIEDDFVASLAAAIDRQIRWSMTVTDNRVFLTTGDATFETSPEVWVGEWRALDPTFGQDLVDATHLKLSEGNNEGALKLTEFIGIVGIKIIEN
ncbi:YaeQ family protein, partial [Patescibacteria group bacterium]|nr:YaeQ family protein [Patescibacteria group bacterium]